MLGDGVWFAVRRFQFIPNVLDCVEVRALCRPLKLFHQQQTGKTISYGRGFVHGRIVMLKHKVMCPHTFDYVVYIELTRQIYKTIPKT